MEITYYRCCWHVISISLFLEYRHLPKADSSSRKALYTPKGFFEHAASHRQAFAHCELFSTAASRRSRARVAVPLLGNTLSYPLPVIALVSHYLTNKLISRRPLIHRNRLLETFTRPKEGLSGISSSFDELCLCEWYVSTCY